MNVNQARFVAHVGWVGRPTADAWVINRRALRTVNIQIPVYAVAKHGWAGEVGAAILHERDDRVEVEGSFDPELLAAADPAPTVSHPWWAALNLAQVRHETRTAPDGQVHRFDEVRLITHAQVTSVTLWASWRNPWDEDQLGMILAPSGTKGLAL